MKTFRKEQKITSNGPHFHVRPGAHTNPLIQDLPINLIPDYPPGFLKRNGVDL